MRKMEEENKQDERTHGQEEWTGRGSEREIIFLI